MLLKTRSRNQSPRRKSKSNEEKQHLDKVAQLDCIICNSPACIHHIRSGRGMAQRSSHYQTISLCHNHHQGKEGIHTLGTKKWQEIYGKETDLLKKVKEKIREMMNGN